MNRRFRTTAVHIALAAMLLRALMPAGWMPSAAASAGTPITICTMHGAVQMALGADGQPLKKSHNQDNSRHHEMCPFAAAPFMAQPAAIGELALLSPISMPAGSSAHRGIAVHTARYVPQSPRAPPRFV
jgi:hypothetical protein